MESKDSGPFEPTAIHAVLHQLESSTTSQAEIQDLESSTIVQPNPQPLTPSADTRPSLLTLPRELRDMIWAYVLLKPDTLCTTAGRPAEYINGRFSYSASHRLPNLLHTNRQIRKEVGEIYYGKTIFLCDIPQKHTPKKANGITWLESLHKAALKHINYVGFLEDSNSAQGVGLFPRAVCSLGFIDFAAVEDAPWGQKQVLDEIEKLGLSRTVVRFLRPGKIDILRDCETYAVEGAEEDLLLESRRRTRLKIWENELPEGMVEGMD